MAYAPRMAFSPEETIGASPNIMTKIPERIAECNSERMNRFMLQFSRPHDNHLLDLHFRHRMRYSADAEARLPQAGERHPIDPKSRMIVDHYGRGVQPPPSPQGRV